MPIGILMWMPQIIVKRVYDPPEQSDGLRVLVDRLWPRGLSKDRAKIDHWPKALAPSTELRKWFGHAPEKWEEFQRRYRAELNANSDQLAELNDTLAGETTVTLLFGAKEVVFNHAHVLKEYLLKVAPR